MIFSYEVKGAQLTGNESTTYVKLRKPEMNLARNIPPYLKSWVGELSLYISYEKYSSSPVIWKHLGEICIKEFSVIQSRPFVT